MADLDQLWAAWDAGGRQRSDLDALTAEAVSFVNLTIRAVRPGSEHPLDDLRQEGMIGLIDAVHTYDPSRGPKFVTHAQNKVRSKVRDLMRSNDTLSRGARARERQLESATAALTHQYGRAPGDEELARRLGWTERQVQQARLDAVAAHSAEFTADDDLEASGSDTYDRIRARVAAAMNTLAGNERAVVVLYYLEEMTMEEVAAVLGVSRSLVSRIRDRAAQQVMDELRRS